MCVISRFMALENYTNYLYRETRGGYYGIPFTFLKITFLVFNKNSKNPNEYIK